MGTTENIECGEAIRQTQIGDQISRQDTLINQVANLLNMLEDSLSKVLVGRQEENCEDIAKNPNLVPLAYDIHTNNERLELQVECLQNIIDRLEL